MDVEKLIRQIAHHAGRPPQDRAAPEGKTASAMPENRLRFFLEYSARPDPARESERVRAVLDSAHFTLSPIGEGAQIERFLVLEFPGIENSFSARALFSMGHWLAGRLDLVSCEPDFGARIYPDPDAPMRVPGSESAIVDLWCRSDAAVPQDRLWALKAIRAPQAWAYSAGQGSGIFVAQPDTGIARHAEIEQGMIAQDKTANILEGGTDPTDPLSADDANPGHGTATGSVVASRGKGQMSGSAPKAKLVPIRCITDVKIFYTGPVTAAIVHARTSGCDVISMSLGGLPGGALNAAIRDAEEAGCIVLAAAGNCVKIVVYPAAYENVIAVAGVDHQDKPWKGTSQGDAIDISAPAENVYVARRTPADPQEDKVEPGQGTSFAVALTAGVAALWLAHHGRNAVRNEAQKRGISVQALFRAALQQTARTPAEWPEGMGPGVVNAEALLKLGLGSIEIAAATPEIATEGDAQAVFRLAGARTVVEGFDWARHGREGAWLAAEGARIFRRATMGMEAVGTGALTPSDALAVQAPAVLRRLYAPLDDIGGPSAPTAPSPRTESIIRQLTRAKPGSTESTGGLSVEAAVQSLRGKRGEALVEGFKAGMQKVSEAEAAERTAEIAAERAETSRLVERVIEKIGASGVAARLNAEETFAAEALVQLHGRPVFRVRDGQVPSDDPLIGEWDGPFLAGAHLFNQYLPSIGRINQGGQHVGTGFVVGHGRIMTNRHVLEALGEEIRTPGGHAQWILSNDVTIHFDDDGEDAAAGFAIGSVVAAAPGRIDGTVNFAHLDMVLLEAETINAAGRTLPVAIPFVKESRLAQKNREIGVVGFPARPGTSMMRDPVTGKVRQDIVQRLQRLFGLAYSKKYISPGMIDVASGALPDDERGWVFAHDATTLPGSSGSCAFHFGDPFGIVGLHFGGGTLRANYAHSVAAVRADTQNPLTPHLNGFTWI